MAQNEALQDICPKCGQPLKVEYGTGYCHGCRVIVDPQLIQGQKDSKTPATNADRIRAMSDEELVDFLNTFNVCDTRTTEECRMTFVASCRDCVLDWLRQPATMCGEKKEGGA